MPDMLDVPLNSLIQSRILRHFIFRMPFSINFHGSISPFYKLVYDLIGLYQQAAEIGFCSRDGFIKSGRIIMMQRMPSLFLYRRFIHLFSHFAFPSFILISRTEERRPPYSEGISPLNKVTSLIASELNTEKKPRKCDALYTFASSRRIRF